MGANSQQGWSLLLFLVGFTFLPAGLFALGPIFTIGGLACLIAGLVWFFKIKPLEHLEPETKKAEPVSMPSKARHAG
jgi:membrane-bound ClpP family serine protease